MGYQDAHNKAWDEISRLTDKNNLSVKFLADSYDVDLQKREILSCACNVPAKGRISIIILHYLIQKLKLKVLPSATNEWISFKELQGGEGYYPTFKKRTITVILRKYADNPEALLELTKRFPAKRVQEGDYGIVLEPFEGVPILITMWKGDDEFGPEANISFDSNISSILCTEDIVVMTELIVHSL